MARYKESAYLAHGLFSRRAPAEAARCIVESYEKHKRTWLYMASINNDFGDTRAFEAWHVAQFYAHLQEPKPPRLTSRHVRIAAATECVPHPGRESALGLELAWLLMHTVIAQQQYYLESLSPSVAAMHHADGPSA
jgi:hypothetical protein